MNRKRTQTDNHFQCRMYLSIYTGSNPIAVSSSKYSSGYARLTFKVMVALLFAPPANSRLASLGSFF